MPSVPSLLKIIQSTIGDDTYQFWYCPGCREIHFFKNSLFTYNGNSSSPTFDPGYVWDNKCSGVINLGTIAYDECTHQYANTEISLPRLPRYFCNILSRNESTIILKHELQTL